jgi:metallophosphoesterase (TIGR00282 family)
VIFQSTPEKGIEGRNNLKILAIGDITSQKGLLHLAKNLWSFREKNGIDFVVANGENASFVTGISPEGATELLRGGVDCITGGNHTLRNHKIYTYIEEESAILRPINFGDSAPGRGYALLDASGYRVLVINAMGVVNIEPRLNSPYGYIDALLSEMEGKYDLAVLDIHAEATGEKLALGFAYDGKINIIFGTHTHVPTADGQILPCGTGYITDVGMCGESGGVLGMDPKVVVQRQRTALPYPFKAAEGAPRADGVIFDFDMKTKRVVEIKRISI